MGRGEGYKSILCNAKCEIPIVVRMDTRGGREAEPSWIYLISGYTLFWTRLRECDKGNSIHTTKRIICTPRQRLSVFHAHSKTLKTTTKTFILHSQSSIIFQFKYTRTASGVLRRKPCACLWWPTPVTRPGDPPYQNVLFTKSNFMFSKYKMSYNSIVHC